MSVALSAEVLDHLTGSYQLDPAHTRLGFAARHALVTRVHGWFDSFEARLHLDASDLTRCSAALTIDVASIRSNNPDRDAHLRSGDFFDVERYPAITFDSTGVTPLGTAATGSQATSPSRPSPGPSSSTLPTRAAASTPTASSASASTVQLR